ncbi:CAZyme family AA7 [Penicillium roqueforti]|uniref:CAZyme family AA7 n=1 Tax=Penicillium roqueforti TaxID=5082 RepID=UPI00190C46D4|nr:CAZyme family AA7 [Penicillium roqueforti]KAF9240326.1 CAZyme family AA7 [Penicillium roqueforti]KAI1835301.1 CAZyme family AA7 [Penicillium roqueforti]KAI2715156.1 CAZyme family AA7 [Penicillium roqueforti]KAI2719968.1 CAZyme family AA7 [Penicillium roqueforti]KAI2720544.1 CAZyme family AA7 [Penicillium roqueforti]
MPEMNATALDALRSRLKTATIYAPESEGYKDVLVRWSNTGMKYAGVVIQPIDTLDISIALSWAQQYDVDLAVKGGGHSTAGTSSSDGGLVIDLSRMNQVTVDTERKTITAQGGATWKEVDEAGAVHSLAAVGGTVNHTGVGGLTLGGGYGWLSGQYGLTIDNLLSATVVLADGRIVTASATENVDLFWGLRGAGYNFGVVADFTYQAYDQKDPVYSGLLGFTSGKLEGVMDALNNSLAKPDSRFGAICIFALAPDGSGPMIIVIGFYNGPLEEGQKRFASLTALEPVLNTLDMVPYSVVNTLQNPQATYGDRKSFKGIFYEPPLDPHFARVIFNDFIAKIRSEPDLKTSAIILEFVDMRKICEVPLTGTALASRNPTQNGIIYLRWTDSSKDLEHRTWAREVQSKWKVKLDARTKDQGVDSGVPQYINYAEPGDSVVSNIYGENLQRLQEVKAKYDPKNVFHKMQPIPMGADLKK